MWSNESVARTLDRLLLEYIVLLSYSEKGFTASEPFKTVFKLEDYKRKKKTLIIYLK